MEKNKRNRRAILVGSALGGLGLIGLTAKKAKAAVGEENVFLSSIAAASVAIKETVSQWKTAYDEFASSANNSLGFIKPIKEVADDLKQIDKDIRDKKREIANLSNRFHKATRDPLSFRFPSIDPFTTEIFSAVESRFAVTKRAIDNFTGKGKTGKAKQLKNVAKTEAQSALGVAAARAQRNELDQLKKMAARNAKEDPDQTTNEILTRSSMPYLLETMQQLLEATRQNGEILSQIHQNLSGIAISGSSMSQTSLKDAMNKVKEGRGTFIDDKGI